MKQLIAKHGYNAGYGGATQYLSLWGSDGSWAFSVTFGIDSAKTPCILAGTFSNLVVTSYDTLGTGTPSAAVTLLVNGVATTLGCTVPAGSGGGASDSVNTVTVAQGDDVEMRLVSGSQQLIPGYDVSFSVEFEGSGTTESQYGVKGFMGSLAAGNGKCAGALGNGEWAAMPFGTNLSNTYSIDAMNGNVTGYYIKDYGGALGAATWTAHMRLNGVLQDGSGGTVDTTASMTGSTSFMTTSFTLPVVQGDHVEVAVALTGAAVGSDAHLGTSVRFQADTDGQFMWCGGNNNAIDGSATTYAWLGSFEEVQIEARAVIPIGPSGLTALGNYVEVASAPSAGKNFVYTVRKSGQDTANVITIADAATTGSVTETVNYSPGDTLALQLVPTNSPSVGEVHWGLIGSLAVSPPVPPTVVTSPLRRLRQFMLPFNRNLTAFLDKLEFICQAGVGLSAGPTGSPVQGETPQIMVRLSRDGGNTWGPERWLPLGPQGQYQRRAVWRAAGSYRDGVVQVTVTDPVFATLLGCDGDITAGIV